MSRIGKMLLAIVGGSMGMLFCALAVSAALKAPVKQKTASKWVEAAPLVLPTLPDSTSEAAAGCVVVGLHVADDGNTQQPRVMQGAYVRFSESQQAAYTAAVLKAASAWKFTSSDGARPEYSFHWVTVGFSKGPVRKMGGLVGPDVQDARLQDHCEVQDLAVWGEANSISAAEAAAKYGDRFILEDPATGTRSDWIPSKMVPPKYWRQAVMVDAQACVIVGVMVTASGEVKDGRVLALKVLKRTPEKMSTRFGEEAVAAVRQWRFSPGPDNLVRMPGLIQIPFEFRVGSAGWDSKQCEKVGGAELVKAISQKG